MNLFDKIKKVASKFKDADQTDQETMAQWERDAKKAMVMSDLSGHDGVKVVLEEIERRITSIDNKLRTERDLTQEKRDQMFGERDAYYWLEGIFKSAKTTLDDIERDVDSNL